MNMKESFNRKISLRKFVGIFAISIMVLGVFNVITNAQSGNGSNPIYMTSGNISSTGTISANLFNGSVPYTNLTGVPSTFPYTNVTGIPSGVYSFKITTDFVGDYFATNGTSQQNITSWASTNGGTVIQNAINNSPYGSNVMVGIGNFTGNVILNQSGVNLIGSSRQSNDTATYEYGANNQYVGTTIIGTVTVQSESCQVWNMIIQGSLNLTKRAQWDVFDSIAVLKDGGIALGIYSDVNYVVNDWYCPFSDSFYNCLFKSDDTTDAAIFYSNTTAGAGGHYYFYNTQISGGDTNILHILGHFTDITFEDSFLYPLANSGYQNIIKFDPPCGGIDTYVTDLNLDNMVWEFLYPTHTNVINFGDDSLTEVGIYINGGDFRSGDPANLVSDGTSSNPQLRTLVFDNVNFGPNFGTLNFNQTSNTHSLVQFEPTCQYAYINVTATHIVTVTQNNVSTAYPACFPSVTAPFSAINGGATESTQGFLVSSGSNQATAFLTLPPSAHEVLAVISYGLTQPNTNNDSAGGMEAEITLAGVPLTGYYWGSTTGHYQDYPEVLSDQTTYLNTTVLSWTVKTGQMLYWTGSASVDVIMSYHASDGTNNATNAYFRSVLLYYL
jgi:hypothetical protein